MSAGKTSASGLAKWKLAPLQVSSLIVLLVFLCIFFIQRQGWFQFLEFQTYDFFIRQQPKAASTGPIVLVEMTEADIHSPSLDWPIYDDKLAELLRILEADQPAVIGLDIWRDMPVPKSNVVGIAAFNQTLQTRSNIVAMFTLGGIAPPEILKSNPDRVAFNDNLIVDYSIDHTIPKVRRSALFAQSKSESFDSLPFKLALVYL